MFKYRGELLFDIVMIQRLVPCPSKFCDIVTPPLPISIKYVKKLAYWSYTAEKNPYTNVLDVSAVENAIRNLH